MTVTRINDNNRDSATGFRYYLPRPYVVVKKPFVVGGDEILVGGTIDDKGRVQFNTKDKETLERLTKAGLGGMIGVNEIRADLVTPAGFWKGRYQQQSSGGQPQASGTKATVTPDLENKYLTGSSATPTYLAKDTTPFQVVAKLAKGNSSSLTDVKDVVVGILPVAISGEVDATKFIALTLAPGSTTWKPDTDGVYTAVGDRDYLPGSGLYAVAVRFQGRLSPAQPEGPQLIHGTQPILTVAGVVEMKGEKASDKSQESTEASGGQSLLATAGDPQTNAFVKLEENEHFDILYLPDLEEQYAIEVSSGLGSATLQLGLENGWMLERATLNVDNREIGKFIFRNIDKFTDIGAAALKAAALPPAVAAATPAQQQVRHALETEGTAVLLRVIYAVEALPGTYPVVKLSEVRVPQNDYVNRHQRREAIANEWVWLAAPPDTRVSYSVRRTVAVELVSVQSTKEEATPTETWLPAAKEIDELFVKWLESDQATKGVVAIIIEYRVKLEQSGAKLRLIVSPDMPSEAKEALAKLPKTPPGDLGGKVNELIVAEDF